MMTDAWFWPYLVRVLLITGVMVGLIYAVFFYLKFKQPGLLPQPGQADKPTSPPVPKSALLTWLSKRLGLPNGSQPVPQVEPTPANPVQLASVHALPLPTSVASAATSTNDNGAVQLFGPHAMGANQTVSVLTVDNTRYVLAATPEGITVLDTQSIPDVTPETKATPNTITTPAKDEVAARG